METIKRVEEGCSLPSSSNELGILIRQLKREVKALATNHEKDFLNHDGKIAEMCKYIKDNLSNSIRELLDTMITSGELDKIIVDTITDIGPQLDELEEKTDNLSLNQESLIKDSSVFKLYAPSLLNRSDHESIALIKGKDHAILFDTGLSNSVDSNVNYLSQKLGSQKINAIFISHYHYDHIGGLNGLSSLLSDDCVVYLPMNFNSYMSGTDDISELNSIRNSVLTYIRANKLKYVEIDSDRVINFGELSVKVFNSNAEAYNYYKSINVGYNAFSMNCLVSLGNTKVLFPGDSNQYTQDYLVNTNQVEKVNVYASNHHGYERYVNSEYLSKLNPEVEYFSVCPSTWDDVNMLSYDFNYKNKATKYITEAFDDIEIGLSKNSHQVIKGYYANDNMFINKVYDIYINPNFSGIPDGSLEKPFRTINQALTTLPREGCNITLHFTAGTYEKLRFIATNNLIQVVAEGEVIFKDIQLNNISAIYFNGIKFVGPVVSVYGYVYFNNCSFECLSSASGNIAITLNRINASFNNCRFDKCYTGVYAQANCQVTLKGCSINAEAYAIYSLNSYVALTDYTITKGTIRCDEGSIIKSVDKGATDKRPVFNNSDYMRGYQFFDTKLGKPIFYYNSNGIDGWIDSTGQAV